MRIVWENVKSLAFIPSRQSEKMQVPDSSGNIALDITQLVKDILYNFLKYVKHCWLSYFDAIL